MNNLNITKVRKLSIFSFILFLLFSCKQNNKVENLPLRYIFDIRGNRDSLFFNNELGYYKAYNSRFLFYIEDGKDSIFYLTSFDFDSCQSLPLDNALKNEIISLSRDLIQPSVLNANSDENSKSFYLIIQSINSDKRAFFETTFIESCIYYNEHLSEISKPLEEVFNKVQNLTNTHYPTE